MDTQGVINLAISALLALALFNVRQIFQRLDRLENGNSKRDVDVAELRSGHYSMTAWPTNPAGCRFWGHVTVQR